MQYPTYCTPHAVYPLTAPHTQHALSLHPTRSIPTHCTPHAVFPIIAPHTQYPHSLLLVPVHGGVVQQ